jgi:hypothetical protein
MPLVSASSIATGSLRAALTQLSLAPATASCASSSAAATCSSSRVAPPLHPPARPSP